MADTDNTPIGTEPSGGVASQAVAGDSSPDPVEIGDDTLVKIPGQDEPVRYGDLYKRQQADYTRKTQQHAKQVAEWERQQKERDAQYAQREQELRQIAATLLQQQQQGRGGQQSYLAQLESRPYVDGRTAAELFRQVQDKGFGSVAEAIKQRDATISTMGEQINQLSQMVRALQGTTATSMFDKKIDQWLADQGLPSEAADWAKEMYLGYEPSDDLDSEFPALMKQRWDQLGKLHTQQTRSMIERDRKPIFPTKGGQGAAGGQVGLKGHESAKETADYWWDKLQADASQRT